jgi:hypothetical protein
MKIFVSVLILCFISQAQKRFNADYFISKYNLNLPKITKDMLDISEFTHNSDLWESFYQGKTEKLDSITRKLAIQGFDSSRRVIRYNYESDSVVVREVSVSLTNYDTLSNWITTSYSNNFNIKKALNLKTNCIYKSSFDERGIKMLDVSKCPGDTGFDGQVFYFDKKEEYLEKYRNKNGKIDSNSIRRYYLTPFDSIVADFIVRREKEPSIVRLNVYNNSKKKQYSYGFDFYRNINEVYNFNYYTYNNKGLLHRNYYFFAKDIDAKVKSYELVNYTEYEYDSLGRKIRETTRVKPDVKEPDTEDKIK